MPSTALSSCFLEGGKSRTGRPCAVAVESRMPDRFGPRAEHDQVLTFARCSASRGRPITVAEAAATASRVRVFGRCCLGTRMGVLRRPSSRWCPLPTCLLWDRATIGGGALPMREKRAVRQEEMRAVLITHDLGQVRRPAHELAFLHHGRIVERTLGAASARKRQPSCAARLCTKPGRVSSDCRSGEPSSSATSSPRWHAAAA
jgi:hypothetical protein